MLTLSTQNLVVVDLETTGTNPFFHDVLAVGLVPLMQPAPPRVVYVRLEQPHWGRYAKVNFEKFGNGIFAAIWESQAVPPAAACEAIEQYLEEVFHGEEVTPIGHNVGFDVAFLRKLAFLAGKDELRGYR